MWQHEIEVRNDEIQVVSTVTVSPIRVRWIEMSGKGRRQLIDRREKVLLKKIWKDIQAK